LWSAPGQGLLRWDELVVAVVLEAEPRRGLNDETRFDILAPVELRRLRVGFALAERSARGELGAFGTRSRQGRGIVVYLY
jgi:hypothetical protein